MDLDYSMSEKPTGPVGGEDNLQPGQLDYSEVKSNEPTEPPLPGELDYSHNMEQSPQADELEDDITDDDYQASHDGESFDDDDDDIGDEVTSDKHMELSGYVERLEELAVEAGDFNHDYRECLEGPITDNLIEGTRQLMLLKEGKFTELQPDLISYAETAEMQDVDLLKSLLQREGRLASPLGQRLAEWIIQSSFQALNGK